MKLCSVAKDQVSEVGVLKVKLLSLECIRGMGKYRLFLCRLEADK